MIHFAMIRTGKSDCGSFIKRLPTFFFAYFYFKLWNNPTYAFMYHLFFYLFMDSEDLKHPELILYQYRTNLLQKLKLTAILIICQELVWITYIIIRIINLPRNFESILTIFSWMIYGVIVFLILYYTYLDG